MVKYLNALKLYKLAESENVDYDALCWEMLVTCNYKAGHSSMHCRFLGIEYEVTLQDMHDAFGFFVEKGLLWVFLIILMLMMLDMS